MTVVNNDFSRLELSREACAHNIGYFRSLLKPETKMLVLVKANAYGHGAVEFARMLQEEGVDYLAVAMPVEGIELREAGISLPIMILTAGTDFLEEIVDNHFEPGIPNLYTLKALCDVLKARGLDNYPIHIKLDTGMHRLGFVEEEMDELMEYLSDCPYVKVESVYSHFAVADDENEDDFTISQAQTFKHIADNLSESLGYKPMYHILNTSGIERFPQFQFDMVRLGLGVYGWSLVSKGKLRPVAALKVKIIQIKTLTKGTIGYGRRGLVAKEGTVVATIPAGYADGLDRHLGCGKAHFLLNGKRVPTIGSICMDMTMLDISGVDAQVGDTVTIFGENPTVEEIAGILDTIPYEILTSVPRRIERVIV